MAKAANLVSIPTLVQSPFIIANIGGVTFGTFSGNYRTNATYPNYMESMSVTKVNGTVNTYTLNFHYQVATGQDPNLLDKIFSRATKIGASSFSMETGWRLITYIRKSSVL